MATLSDWIIPARAGFTQDKKEGSQASQDHPRSRGVYYPVRRRAIVILGSSPLARGLRELVQGEGGQWGIIPARAGCP